MDKFRMGPEFIGKTKDNNLSSKTVDETQTVDEIQIRMKLKQALES